MKKPNVPEINICVHHLIISTGERTIALSELTEENLQQIQTWVENDELEYEIFPTFDCGPGPNGPELYECCQQLEIDAETVLPDGDETSYNDKFYYVETIERYYNSELSISVSLPNEVRFDPTKIILKHHPRYTSIITEIQYPDGEVSWQLESEFKIDEREWNFYKCINGNLHWIDIEEELSSVLGKD